MCVAIRSNISRCLLSLLFLFESFRLYFLFDMTVLYEIKRIIDENVKYNRTEMGWGFGLKRKKGRRNCASGVVHSSKASMSLVCRVRLAHSSCASSGLLPVALYPFLFFFCSFYIFLFLAQRLDMARNKVYIVAYTIGKDKATSRQR